MRDLTIRPATVSDASSIAAIYNHYVRTSTATFDTQERSLDEQIAWLASTATRIPSSSSRRERRRRRLGLAQPVGHAAAPTGIPSRSRSTSPPRPRARASDRRSATPSSTARASCGHHAIISQIVHENEPSLSMARRLGFEHVGTLREVGRKFDRWLDVVLMELVLDTEADAVPRSR